MTPEQTRDLVETLRWKVAVCEAEDEKWSGSHPRLAQQYRERSFAYRHVLELIAATKGEEPANPLTPPADPATYAERD